MKLSHYELLSGDQSLSYEFISEGPKGNIIKLLQFSLIDENHIYNLAFGDLNVETGEIDDLIVTDNDDSEKVLATIVAAIYAFCEHFPDAWIYATGSTGSRNRLYRMGLNKYFTVAMEEFKIFGQMHDEWKHFEKGKDYQAFLVQKKM